MERDVDDETFGKDELRLTEDELDDVRAEIGTDAHGHITEGFERVVIELANGQELEFTGYGGGAVNLAVNAPGLNQHSCVICEEEKSDWALDPIRHRDADRPTVYICRECREDTDHPINQLLTQL